MHARTHARMHAHTHTFNGPLSGITRVSQYQKDKTNLDFTEARDSEWQWHQLGRMQVCTSFQTDNHASTPPLSFLQARCPSWCPTNCIKALKAAYNNNLLTTYLKSLLQTLTADLRLGPDCSLTANAVVLVKQLNSLHAPSQRTVFTPYRAGNYKQTHKYNNLLYYTLFHYLLLHSYL